MNHAPGRKTILVVDDERAIRSLLVVNLEAEGHGVRALGDGLTAYHQVLAAPPDIVILDVMMPGLDGIQTLELLRGDERTRDVPVVLLTAKSSDDDVWRGWTAGADSYITKPFDVDELIRVVSELLSPDVEPPIESCVQHPTGTEPS